MVLAYTRYTAQGVLHLKIAQQRNVGCSRISTIVVLILLIDFSELLAKSFAESKPLLVMSDIEIYFVTCSKAKFLGRLE